MQNDAATLSAEWDKPKHTRQDGLYARKTRWTPKCSKNESGSAHEKIFFEKYEYNSLLYWYKK